MSNQFDFSFLRRNEQGEMVFYPYGFFLKGYVVSESGAARLKDFVTRFYLMALAVIVLAIFRVPYAAYLGIPVILYYFVAVSAFLKREGKQPYRMSFGEALHTWTEMFGSRGLLLVIGAVVVLVVIFVGARLLLQYG